MGVREIMAWWSHPASLFALLVAALVCSLSTQSVAELSEAESEERLFMFSVKEREYMRVLAESEDPSDRELLSMMITKRLMAMDDLKLRRNVGDASSTCECKCNVDQLNLLFPFSSGGYGKYCGAGYTCEAGDPGCDDLDSCCRIHDFCVGNHSYCDSCACNLAIVNCAASVKRGGFESCDMYEEARTNVLEDICFVLKYGSSWCGACNRSTEIPPICYEY